MATIYTDRSAGGCRQRAGDDVVEPWFVLSRSAYQRILDMALAEMTSAEVLHRTCCSASSSRSTELLRLLGNSVDVNSEMSRNEGSVEMKQTPAMRWEETDPGRFKSPTCLSNSQVAGNTRSTDSGRSPTKHLPVHCRSVTQMSSIVSTVILPSSQPLCLRVPSYNRRRQIPTRARAKCKHVTPTRQMAPAAAARCDNDRDNVSVPSAARSSKDSERLDDRVVDVSRSADRADCIRDRKQLEPVESERRKHKTTEQVSNRKCLCKPGEGVMRVEAGEIDGWAPIDKDVLVSIVERLSVSCLEPSTAQRQLTDTTSSSACESYPPLPTVTVTSLSTTSSGILVSSGIGDVDAEKRDDVVKRAPQSLTSPCEGGSDDASPPYKTQRLRSVPLAPPTLIVSNSVRRKPKLHRRVQVRDTWTVPADKSLSTSTVRISAAAEATMRDLINAGSLTESRHVWAPLEKSVVLSVVDHILVDGEVDGEKSSSDEWRDNRQRRSEQSSSRRRWLQPPSLRVIGGPASPADSSSSTASFTDQTSTAVEASFKWKSNILLRMRKEQTMVSSSGDRWLDVTSNPVVAATGN